MNCTLCSSMFSFSDQHKLPRVLTQCGHTFCHSCIKNNLEFRSQFKHQITCKQCGKLNFCQQGQNFPINGTLLAILKNSQEGSGSVTKEEENCKLHGRKLQAFCQNQQALLCLNCVLTGHKSHKVISITEKVEQDKSIMKNCLQKIIKSKQFVGQKLLQYQSLIDKLNLDLNQYVFQINLLYKNIISQLKESEQNFINQAKRSIQKSIKQIQSIRQLLQQKQLFYQEITSIYSEVNQKSGLAYLKENNKRVFILQNCHLKDKFAANFKKERLNQQKVLIESIKSLQQLLQYERKKAGNTSQRKAITSQYQTKNSEKTLKESRKQGNLVSQSIQSPTKFLKKSISGVPGAQKCYKQPHILQVNLVQKYQKYQQTKNMKKRNSQIILTNSNSKSPKIQYEVKNDFEQSEKRMSKNSENGSRVDDRKRQIFQKGSQKMKNKFQVCQEKKQLKSMQNKNQYKPPKTVKKSLSSSKMSGVVKQELALSFMNQSDLMSSPSRKQNNTFEVQTPFSINSFMDSSRFTIPDENVSYFRQQQTVLKDSRTSFTMLCLMETIYHLGGLKNDSIDCLKLEHTYSNKIQLTNNVVLKGFNRSKFQTITLNKYSPTKCLILGGKQSNGQRSNQILQFDLQSHKLQKSNLYLVQAISGFGAVTYDNKLYVFGGSSSSALKTMYEYKIGKTGFDFKKMSSMINTRDQLGFVMGFDGYIYACGGINSSNLILNSCQKYCFKTNRWYSIPAMKSPRRSFSLISLPNAIYAVGGHDGKSFLNTVEMYEWDKQKWSEVASMNQGRFTHSAVSTNDFQNIIVFGGFENSPLKTVQIYDIVQNKWSFLRDMENERYLHSTIIMRS